MAHDAKKKLSGIRTYAADLEAVREKRAQETSPTPKEEKKKKKKFVTDKLKAPVDIKPPKKETVSTPIPTPEPVEVENITVTEEKSEKSKPKDTKILAFHEIQKQAKKISSDTEINSKDKSRNKKTEKRPNVGYDTAIITDTKSNRFKLVPSVVKSVGKWFKNLASGKKKSPKYVVPETQRRKGVIQEATSKTGTIFTADNETLREQIRRRHRKHPELYEDNELDATWTPFTNVGFKLLEAPEGATPDVTQNVKIEYKKQKPIIITEPSKPKVAPVAEPEEVPEPVPQTSPEPEPEPEEEKVKESTPEPTLEPTPEPTPEPELELEPEMVEEEIPETPEEEVEPEPVYEERRGFDRFDTNTQTVIILVAVIGLVTIIIAARLIFVSLNGDANGPASNIVPTESLIEGANLNETNITSSDFETLSEAINNEVKTGPAGLLEIAVVQSGEGEVKPANIFESLQFHTLPSLKQSITAVRFVSINHSQPTVLLKFVDQDTVRGAMLEWESNMASDLANIYGFEADGATEFTDEIVYNINVRVIKNGEGETLLVYGIIDDNTALISASENDFTQVLELGFNED